MRASWPGIGISMIRSNRPGRSRASSRMSGRFVAPMIFTSPSGLKPSSSARSCMSVRWTSRSPDVAISRRFAPTESSSSMNTIDGDFSRASWNSSRTSRAPSPMYFWTNSDPTNRMKVAHHGERLLVQRDARPDDEVLFRDVVRRVHDEIRTRGRLHDDAAVRQDVPDVADDQGWTLEPVELLLEPPNLFLESPQLRLDITLLALGPSGRLQELVVAVLEGGDPLRH